MKAILCPHGITPKRNCKECEREYRQERYDRAKRKSEKSKPKMCLNCGLEFTGINYKFCNSSCCDEYRGKKRLQRKLEEKKIEKAPKGKCPLLEACKKASGIDCSKRNHLKCPFYQTVLREKEGRIQGFKKGEIQIAI